MLPLFAAPMRRLIPSTLLVAATLATAALVAACGRAESTADQVDPTWRRDSLVLTEATGVVFRAIDLAQGRAVAPIAMMGPGNIKRIRLSDRGWHILDSTYLTPGKTLQAMRSGRPAGSVRVTRRMWEPFGPLDSLPGCPRLVPAGLADVPASVDLLVAGQRPTLKPVSEGAQGAMSEALASIPTLVAPVERIPTDRLGRYRREVHQAATGATRSPTMVVIYNDPEQVADTVVPLLSRPRQLVVVLDQGNYAYHKTFTYTTLGNALAGPRLEFLDYLDIDGDGVAELFFNAMRNGKYESTVILHYGVDKDWREVMNEVVRCQG